MQQTGFEHLSDDDLMRLMQQGAVNPVNAETGQPLPREQAQGYQQLGAAGGIDPNAVPGSPRLPRAMVPGGQPNEGDFYMDEQGRVHQQPPLSDMRRSVMGGVRAFARGIPAFGQFMDEANAASAAAVAPALEPVMRHAPKAVQDILGYDPRLEIGDAGGFMGRYNAAKNIQTFTDDAFSEEHPRTAAGLELGGGITGGVAGARLFAPLTSVAIAKDASLPLRMAAGAGDGAIIGAITGYGMGEGDWNDPSRVKSAAGGGLFGGALGGAAPAVGALASKGWQATGGRLVDAVLPPVRVQSPSSISAADRVVESLRGEPAAAVPRAAAGAAERVAQSLRGDTSGIGGVGPLAGAQRTALEARAMRVSPDLPDVTVRQSDASEAYRRIARAIQRQNMTPEEALAETQRLGPMGVLADTGESTRDLMRAAINRPGRGATIAETNLRPRQNGIFNPETGMYDIRPSSLRLVDQASEGMGLNGREYYQEMDSLLAGRKAAADPAYAKMRAAPPVSVDNFADFRTSPLFDQAYQRARAISQKEFVRVPGVDGEAIMPLPEQPPSHLDWRTLDLMKQGLDDLVKEGRVQGIGANEQGAIKGYLGRFVSKLDALNPDYKAAREAFAGPTAMTEALEAGRAAFREDAPVLAANLRDLSDSERTMYRLGALQALEGKLGNANVTFDAANQAGFLKPNQLKRFRELFPDSKSFTDFYRAMAAEKQMFGTSGAAFNNSSTPRQLLNVMEPNDPQAEGAAMLAGAVTGGGVPTMQAVIPALRRLGMESPMSESAAETIASLLTTNDPALQRSLVERLHGASVQNAAQDTIRRMGAAGAGQTGANFAGRRQ